MASANSPQTADSPATSDDELLADPDMVLDGISARLTRAHIAESPESDNPVLDSILLNAPRSPESNASPPPPPSPSPDTPASSFKRLMENLSVIQQVFAAAAETRNFSKDTAKRAGPPPLPLPPYLARIFFLDCGILLRFYSPTFVSLSFQSMRLTLPSIIHTFVIAHFAMILVPCRLQALQTLPPPPLL